MRSAACALALLCACEAAPVAGLRPTVNDGSACAPSSPAVIAAIRADLVRALEEDDLTGATWALVECGRVQHVGAVGVDNLGEPVNPGTFFHFNVQKLGVGMAAVAAAQAELVDLDAPVNRYLEDLDRLSPGPAPTLAQLLTDTAGIQGGFEEWCDHGGSVQSYLEAWPAARWSEPGELPAMRSDRGSLIAALVLERALGRGYPELLRDLVLVPLGIEATSHRPPASAPLARGAFEVCPVTQVGRLFVSAAGLAGLVAAMVHDNPVFHGPARVSLYDAGAEAYFPSFSRGLAATWGVGPWREGVRAGSQFAGSSTDIALAFSPERELGVVALVNGHHNRVPTTANRFVSLTLLRLIGARAPDPGPAVPGLEGLAGAFAAGEAVYEINVLDGQLRLTAPWSGDVPLSPDGYGRRDPAFTGTRERDVFWDPEVGRHLRFVRDGEGSAQVLLLESSHGPWEPARRIE